jgi:hypothetical protein
VARGGEVATISESDLRPSLDEALDRWSLSLDAQLVEALRNVQVRSDDLDGFALGRLQDGVITIDADAAGHGWFVDRTPQDDREFRLIGDAALGAVGGAGPGARATQGGCDPGRDPVARGPATGSATADRLRWMEAAFRQRPGCS